MSCKSYYADSHLDLKYHSSIPSFWSYPPVRLDTSSFNSSCFFSSHQMWLVPYTGSVRALKTSRAGNKRRLTKITQSKRYVYSTVRLNRPNKGVYFGRSESSKDGRPFLDVQSSTATEMARVAVGWTKLLLSFPLLIIKDECSSGFTCKEGKGCPRGVQLARPPGPCVPPTHRPGPSQVC